jgi:hydrogenase maturation protease
MHKPKDILVLGLGNPLMGDDGVGHAVVESLRRDGLPPGVRTIQALSPQPGLLSDIRDSDLVIIIDAVSSGAEPGTVFRFSFDESEMMSLPAHNCHSLGLPMLLTAVHLQGRFPEALVFGIESGCIEVKDAQLSPPVACSAERVRWLVLKEITEQLTGPWDRQASGQEP